MKYRGHCPEKIVKCGWSKTKGNTDLTNKNDNNHGLAYGEAVYLHIETEGLNGAKLIVEVWNEMFNGDYKIRKIYDAEVLDGEVNLKIPNTHLWRSGISMLQENEEFYVKVKTTSGRYITNGNKETEFGKYLNIKNKIVTPKFEVPSNQTPLKVGKANINLDRYEPCKFDAIKIKDTDAEKKPVTVTVFEGGKTNGKSLEKRSHPEEKITKSILFEFDSAVISAEGQKVLNNVLQFLLEHEHSNLHLSGYACVIGKEAYNQPLSEKRANAVKKVLADGNLDPSRILAKGYGEAYHKDGVTTPKADDNKTGADNIKHKTKTENINARRVDVSFTYFGHDATTIVYETIAPSVTIKKELEIEIIGFDTKKCFQGKLKKHKQETRVIDIGQIENDGNDAVQKFEAAKFPVKVYSDLRRVNLFPLEFIWPASTTPNKVYIHTHSCRWYSNPSNATVLIKVYPDIKWNFHFFLNLSNELSVKWQNLSPAKHKEMQSKAGKIGAEKRWKQTEVDFGVALEANWDKVAKDKYNSHVDATLKYEEKIKQFYSVFASLKEFSKGVTGKTKGTVSKTRLGKKWPLWVDMKPPNFCLGAEWQLERGKIKGKETLEIGTAIEFYFKAEPLIALSINIDLLAGLVQLGVGIATGGSGNLVAMEIFNEVRDWLEDEDHKINLKMYIDLEISGTINGTSKLNINTASDESNGEMKLETVLKAELNAGIELKARTVTIIGEAYLSAEISGKGTASVTFGHGLYFEKNSTEKKVYYQPKLNFDGLKVVGVIKATVGLSIKKGVFKSDSSTDLVDYNYSKVVFAPFDVIKKLEEVTAISSKINLT